MIVIFAQREGHLSAVPSVSSIVATMKLGVITRSVYIVCFIHRGPCKDMYAWFSIYLTIVNGKKTADLHACLNQQNGYIKKKHL